MRVRSAARFLRVAGIAGLGAFAGLEVTRLTSLMPALSDPDLAREEVLLTLVRAHLDPMTVGGVLLLAGLGLAYMQVTGSRLEAVIEVRQLLNLLVYGYAVALIVPMIPVQGLVALILLVLVVAGDLRGLNGRLVAVVLTGAVVVGAGLAAGALGWDPVRAQVPISVQITGLLPPASALCAYIVIRRNAWGPAEFGTFFTIVIVGGVLLAFESLATFYVGQPSLPGLDPALNRAGMFISGFLKSHHLVGRIGMSTVFAGLYMYYRFSARWGAIAAVLGYILVFATLNRQIILTTTLGLALLWAVARGGRARTPSAGARRLRALMVVGLAVVVIAGLLVVASEVRDEGFEVTSWNRLILWARAVDVARFTMPIGTGPGLTQYYTGSDLVPAETLQAFATALDLELADTLQRITRSGTFFAFGEKGYTVHSLWVEFVLEWGVAGILAIAWLLLGGLRILRRLRAAAATADRERLASAWAALLLAAMLSVSVITTVKFDLYWYFVVTYAFARMAAHDIGIGGREPSGRTMMPAATAR